jgi:nuclease HARBI1
MDDELVLLTLIAACAVHQSHRSRERTRLFRTVATRFNVDMFNKEACVHLFRFDHDCISLIATHLLPFPLLRLENRCVVPRVEAMCILLHRFCYPNRLEVMEGLFGRQFTVLSRVVFAMTEKLYSSYRHLLLLSSSMITRQLLQGWMDAVYSVGSPLEHCFAFIDGIVRPVSRPSYNQKQAYNGHKRVHSLKFQSVSSPNGLIVDLTGPWEGRRHDCGMLRESGLLPRLEGIRNMMGSAYIYGDPAYPISDVIQAPYKGACLSEVQKEFNMKMSRVRVSVEWCFGKVVSLFPFVDFKKSQKLYLQPVGKYYFVAVLLTNMHTCVESSVTGSFFDINPPSLSEYLSFSSGDSIEIEQ